jgi:phosphoglycolate phosphatase-like HAD superfamily hydrolase
MSAIIFDFDGTIADSFDYIVGFLAAEAKLPPLTADQRQELRGMSMTAIGRHLGHSWLGLVRMFFRGRRLMAGNIQHVHPFEGMPDVIRKLHAEGHELFIVSSNTVHNVHTFLHHHNLHTYFLEIYGGVGLFSKAPALRRVLRNNNLDIKDALYIGDELRDVERSQAYQPGQSTPYKISRSKIELFMQCPRCFWLDARLKIKRPSGPPFRINSAIDELFKKEFDSYRVAGKPHPIMTDNQIKAVPYVHANLDAWRHNFTGVQFTELQTNLLVTGAVDDKATAKASEVNIDSDWQMSYKRQLEVYQWLLRQNGFKVSETGYFVYTNARLDPDSFGDHLEFRTKLIPYTGDDSWVGPTLLKMKACLESNDMPPVGNAAMGGPCDFCSYAKARTELTLNHIKRN